MDNRFISDMESTTMELIYSLEKTDNPARIYASAVAERREKRLQEEYGKPVSVCFCRLFRKKCDSGNCIYRIRRGQWMDHGRMYYDKKSKRYTYIGEPYEISSEAMKELVLLSEKYDLKITVSNSCTSWFPGRTVGIIIQADDL